MIYTRIKISKYNYYNVINSGAAVKRGSTDERCTARAPSNNGEIHWYMQIDSLREFNIASATRDPIAMRANPCRCADGYRN